MIGGCLLVVVLGLVDLGGIDNLRAAVGSAQHTALVLPVDTATPFPWTGILFGLAFVLRPAYWIGNQAIVQRSLGSRSEFEAKASYVWGAVLKSVIPFVVAVPGLIALARFPDLAHSDQAVPALVARLLPVGVRGLFLAAFLAALMSSVDSYLNSAATIVTRDLYGRFVRPAATDRHLLLVGRGTTVALLLWGILFAFLLTGVREGIYAIFQTLMAFFQGPALAVLMGGFLWRRATGPAALAAFVGGVLFAVLLYALNQPAVYGPLGLRPLFRVAEPYLYFSVWAFLVALSLLVVLSLLTRPEPPEKQRYVIYAARPGPVPAAGEAKP
jgi:SSS family solute:Na+ symporter